VFAGLALLCGLLPLHAAGATWGGDILVYGGPVACFDVDYTAGGTVYLCVQRGEPPFPIQYYTSADHGYTWNLRYELAAFSRLTNLRVLVGEPVHNYVFTFFVAPDDSFAHVLRMRSDFSETEEVFPVVPAPQFDAHGFDVARSLGDDYSLLFSGVSGLDQPQQIITLLSSTDYGETWTLRHVLEPGGTGRAVSACWGPPSSYYVAFARPADPGDWLVPELFEIYVAQSTDEGDTWVANQVTSDFYEDFDPHVAACNDTSFPVIWVAATRVWQPGDLDLWVHSTPSPDSAQVWTHTPVSTYWYWNEFWGDIKFYKIGPNRWMNMAWLQADSAGTHASVHWAYASGADPTNWRDDTLISDMPTCAAPELGPRVVYSPGAPASGGGVVWAGADSVDLYLDAPWVAAGAHDSAPTRTLAVSLHPTVLSGDTSLRVNVPCGGMWELLLYDAAGRLVSRCRRQLSGPGTYSVKPRAEIPGAYFARLKLNGSVAGNARVIIAR
jgi:hypothetical protein